MSKIKPPTQELKTGEIYNFDVRNAHQAAINLLDKCRRNCKRIAVRIKDTHTGITTVKYVIPVKH